MSAEENAGQRRILIVGVPTSGKTTLSLRLSDRLQTPVFHLDQVAAADGADDAGRLHAPVGELPTTEFEPRPLPDRRRLAQGIAANAGWIAEGAFLDWTDPLLERADTIIWLDHVSPVGVGRRIVERAQRSMVRESSKRAGPSRWVRPVAFVRHGLGLVRELWDVTGYFWRRHPTRVDEDIAAGRWDRISRTAVTRALEPHRTKVIHVRDAATLDRVEQLVSAPARATPQGAIDA